MLQHSSALVLSHSPACGLIDWNHNIGLISFFFSCHLSGKLAPALWCTHPENRSLSPDPCLRDVLHLIDGVTHRLVGHGAVLLGDRGTLLPVDCGADLEIED